VIGAESRPTRSPHGPRYPAQDGGPASHANQGQGAAARQAEVHRQSHPAATDFACGLRRYAKYRDLDISAATDGLLHAHMIQFVPPCRPEEVSKLHYHDVEFQMVYVLKGWIKTELQGQGGITMRAGSCWIQPPHIKHKVLDYSDDCQVLEIVLPADFKTVELE